ncbi:MAG: gfo/Idh/MocA family oxidoreductase, partial [Planctomycetota bacterium]
MISRRSFIASSTALAAASIHGRPRRAIAATSRITIGMVGMGIQNRGHLGWLLGQGGVQIVAVSDCHAKRLADAAATVEKKYAEEKKSGSFVGC